MKNLSYHYRIVCIHCGYLNHGTIPILAKDGSAQKKCDKCTKYIFELHAKEEEE